MNLTEWMLAVVVVSFLTDRGHCSGNLKDSASKDNNQRNTQALTQTDKRVTKVAETGESVGPFIYGRCSVYPDPANDKLRDVVSGIIDLRQPLHGGPTEIRLNLTGFNRLDRHHRHGARIHEFGDLTAGCRSAGGHYNPFGLSHTATADIPQFKHLGDLGSIEESGDGTVGQVLKDYAISLLGPFSVLGRAAVIHLYGADSGSSKTTVGDTATNSGERLACCTISLSDGAGWS